MHLLKVSYAQLTYFEVQDGGLKETKAPKFDLNFQDESYRSINAIKWFHAVKSGVQFSLTIRRVVNMYYEVNTQLFSVAAWLHVNTNLSPVHNAHSGSR